MLPGCSVKILGLVRLSFFLNVLRLLETKKKTFKSETFWNQNDAWTTNSDVLIVSVSTHPSWSPWAKAVRVARLSGFPSSLCWFCATVRKKWGFSSESAPLPLLWKEGLRLTGHWVQWAQLNTTDKRWSIRIKGQFQLITTRWKLVFLFINSVMALWWMTYKSSSYKWIFERLIAIQKTWMRYFFIIVTLFWVVWGLPYWTISTEEHPEAHSQHLFYMWKLQIGLQDPIGLFCVSQIWQHWKQFIFSPSLNLNTVVLHGFTSVVNWLFFRGNPLLLSRGGIHLKVNLALFCGKHRGLEESQRCLGLRNTWASTEKQFLTQRYPVSMWNRSPARFFLLFLTSQQKMSPTVSSKPPHLPPPASRYDGDFSRAH